MRTVSAPFRSAMFSGDTDEVVVALLTIFHPDANAGELCFSSDNADLLDFEEQLRGTISNGVQYSFIPMEFNLPEDTDESSQIINISISGVSQKATPLLKSVTTPLAARLDIVLASSPDQIEVEYPNFELVSADVDATRIILGLAVDAMLSEPFPADNFTPGSFGGLWATT